MNMEGSFRVKFLDSFFSSFLKKGKKTCYCSFRNMVNLGCSACPVAFCWVLCNLTDYVVPVYSSCDCLSPLVISLRAIMLQTGDFSLYWKMPSTQVTCGSRQDLSFNTKTVSIFNIRLSQSLLWPVLHIQWLIFVLSEHVFFLEPLCGTFIAPKNACVSSALALWTPVHWN